MAEARFRPLSAPEWRDALNVAARRRGRETLLLGMAREAVIIGMGRGGARSGRFYEDLELAVPVDGSS